MGGAAPDSANGMLMPHLDTHSATSSSWGSPMRIPVIACDAIR